MAVVGCKGVYYTNNEGNANDYNRSNERWAEVSISRGKRAFAPKVNALS
jgi:hypothetical protein